MAKDFVHKELEAIKKSELYKKTAKAWHNLSEAEKNFILTPQQRRAKESKEKLKTVLKYVDAPLLLTLVATQGLAGIPITGAIIGGQVYWGSLMTPDFGAYMQDLYNKAKKHMPHLPHKHITVEFHTVENEKQKKKLRDVI